MQILPVKKHWVMRISLLIVLALSACSAGVEEQMDNQAFGTPVFPLTEDNSLPQTGGDGSVGPDSPSQLDPVGESGRGQPVLASNFRSYEIVTEGGQDLPETAGYIFNLDDGRIDFVLLVQDPTRNLTIPIPWGALAIPEESGRQEQVFLLRAGEDSLNRSPLLDLDSPDFTDPLWGEGVMQYWNPLLPQDTSQVDPRETRQGATHVLLESLLSAQVRARGENQLIGDVVDIVIDSETGKAFFLAFQEPGSQQWRLAPWEDLTASRGISQGPGSILIEMDPARVQQLQQIQPGTLPAIDGQGEAPATQSEPSGQ